MQPGTRSSLWFLALAAFALALSIPVAAQEEPFDEATLFFELNDTDGDLGIHALIDGGPWKWLKIEDAQDRQKLVVSVQGSLRKQGLTELFFESAEPTFDELAPAAFFKRFPEGLYDIEGITLDGKELESEVFLSQVMPAPPGNVRVSGVAKADDCEEGVPLVTRPVVIDWNPVTRSHPTLGKKGAVQVEKYQLFVELDNAKVSFDLPPSVTAFRVPPQFLLLGKEFKYEILVRSQAGNQTAIESCFAID